MKIGKWDYKHKPMEREYKSCAFSAQLSRLAFYPEVSCSSTCVVRENARILNLETSHVVS